MDNSLKNPTHESAINKLFPDLRRLYNKYINFMLRESFINSVFLQFLKELSTAKHSKF